MPRQPRIQFPGAFYHVMARGNRREYIFQDDSIKVLLITTLGEAATRYIHLMEEIARKEQTHAGCTDEGDAETLNITLQRGWIYGNTAFREQMKRLIKTPANTSVGKRNDLDKAEHCLQQAQRTWKLTKQEILSKRKSSPEKVSLGIILKETTGLTWRAIAELLNMGHPVSATRLINKGIKEKHEQNATAACYQQLLERMKNASLIMS